MSGEAPLGVFDSGVGGLTVARELRNRLPGESLLYFADTEWVPYGGRPLPTIRDRALAIGTYLEGRGAKALVVACNTACGAGLEALRETLRIPVIGVEPAIKPAVALSRRGTVGVLATQAMLGSARFRRLIDAHAAGTRIVAQACPGLVELVEGGEIDGPDVADRVRPFLEPLRAAGADVVVLGCTHYPFLAPAIQQILGPEVQLVESGAAVARQTERVLRERGSLTGTGVGSIEAVASGNPQALRRIVQRLWGENVPVDGVRL